MHASPITKVTPIRNGIFFIFEDTVDKGFFSETTSFGFIFKNDPDTTVRRARWGTVIAIGHEVGDEIKVGDEILIEPLKWTHDLTFEGRTFWKTDSDHVLAIRYKD